MLDCLFFFGQWLKRKPVSSNSMLVNRIICLVSFLFFIWNFIYLFINHECLVHGFRLCCSTFCMQKMAWIREFLLKFTNFKMQIILDFGYLLVFDFCKCKHAQLHFFISKSACTLHSKVQILLLFCDWI